MKTFQIILLLTLGVVGLMCDVEVGAGSAVNRFKPKCPFAKNYRALIRDFRDFNDAVVQRCKSVEGAKKLNAAFFTSIVCYSNVFDFYGLNENATTLDNIKTFVGQISDNKDQLQTCVNAFFDDAASCYSENELKIFKRFTSYGLDLASNVLVEALEFAFAEKLQEYRKPEPFEEFDDPVATQTQTEAQAKYFACKRSSAFQDFKKSAFEDLREKLSSIFTDQVSNLSEAIEKVFSFAVSFDPSVFFEKLNEFVDKNQNEDCNGLVQWVRKFIEVSKPYYKSNEV